LRCDNREADGIQARQQKNLRALGPVVFLDQLQCRERSGGFVAVDAGGNVKARGIGRAARGAVQRGQFEFAGVMENFRRPAMSLRGGFDRAQHGADVNRLAVVAAVVFAELLHAENIMQRVAPKCNEGGSRQDAKKFFSTWRPCALA
jgi:hypothetical protein